MLIVNAVDDAGNRFRKKLKLYTHSDGRRIVSLGYPVEYDETTWSRIVWNAASHTGRSADLCIDISGRNHHGHPTIVPREELLRLHQYIRLQWARE